MVYIRMYKEHFCYAIYRAVSSDLGLLCWCVLCSMPDWFMYIDRTIPVSVVYVCVVGLSSLILPLYKFVDFNKSQLKLDQQCFVDFLKSVSVICKMEVSGISFPFVATIPVLGAHYFTSLIFLQTIIMSSTCSEK